MRNPALDWIVPLVWILAAVSPALAGGVLPDLVYDELDSGAGTASEANGVDQDPVSGAVVIVGLVTLAGIDVPAFWERDIAGDYVLVLLPDIGGQGGAAEAVTIDAADYGVVASGWVVDGGQDQPCVWTRSSPGDPFNLVLLDTGGGNGGRATAIARLDSATATAFAGPIIELGVGGRVEGLGGSTAATVWTSLGGGPWVRETLGGLPGGGPNSRVVDLDAAGMDVLAVGSAADGGGIARAARWWRSNDAWSMAAILPLPPGAGESRATGVTPTAAVAVEAAACGRVELAGGAVHAYVWRFNGITWTAQDLGVLPGFTGSSAGDLTVRNPAGDIAVVGRSDNDPALSAGLGTLWITPGGVPLASDVNDLIIDLPPEVSIRRANHIADRTGPAFGTGSTLIVGAASVAVAPAGSGPATTQAMLLSNGVEDVPAASTVGLAGMAVLLLAGGAVLARRSGPSFPAE